MSHQGNRNYAQLESSQPYEIRRSVRIWQLLVYRVRIAWGWTALRQDQSMIRFICSKNIRLSSKRPNVSCGTCCRGFVRCTARELCIVTWNPRTFFCDLRTPWSASLPISDYPSSQTQNNFCLSDAALLATWHPKLSTSRTWSRSTDPFAMCSVWG